jgi:hypothetical protein
MTRGRVPEVVAALVVPMVPRAGLRERLLASAVKPGWGPWRGRVAALWDLDEPAVQAVFDHSGDPSGWTATPVPTVTAFHLEGGPATAGADVGLVRIPNGFGFPPHGHTGVEEYIVLDGTLHFADGHREHPGDRVRNDSSVRHAYTAEGDVVVAIVMRGELAPG